MRLRCLKNENYELLLTVGREYRMLRDNSMDEAPAEYKKKIRRGDITRLDTPYVKLETDDGNYYWVPTEYFEMGV